MHMWLVIHNVLSIERTIANHSILSIHLFLGRLLHTSTSNTLFTNFSSSIFSISCLHCFFSCQHCEITTLCGLYWSFVHFCVPGAVANALILDSRLLFSLLNRGSRFYLCVPSVSIYIGVDHLGRVHTLPNAVPCQSIGALHFGLPAHHGH